MVVSFADLKKNAGQSQIDKLNEEAGKFKSGGFARDERYWQPEIDKAGEGGAVIRFLPAPAGEEVPFVRKFSYGFKGPGGRWFIENSPSTLNLPCPVMEYNSELWESGSEDNKDIARKQKRRLGFITNIYVVRHKARPSDEGKVFLYEFGKKIWEKLEDKMNPSDDDRKPMNPFDLWTGANFRLRIANVAGFRNYDKSEFDEAGPLLDDDARLERIWADAHSLAAEISPDKFKSYDELKKKLASVLGSESGAREAVERSQSTRTQTRSRDDEPPFDVDDSKSGGGDLAWLKEIAEGR